MPHKGTKTYGTGDPIYEEANDSGGRSDLDGRRERLPLLARDVARRTGPAVCARGSAVQPLPALLCGGRHLKFFFASLPCDITVSTAIGAPSPLILWRVAELPEVEKT